MPFITTQSNQQLEYFDPDTYADPENKLSQLNAFTLSLLSRYPDHPNLEQSLKLLQAFKFIRLNLDGYINYAVGHQDDLSVYFKGGERDKSNKVLRCPNHISFHIIPHGNQPTEEQRESIRKENIFKLNWRIKEVEEAFTFIENRDDHIIVMRNFLNKIDAAETGCLDQRFTAALQYLLLLKDGNPPKLDDLIQDAITQVQDKDSLTTILFILQFLDNHLDTPVTWSIDNHQTSFLLTREAIKTYLFDILVYADDDWNSCAKSIVEYPHRTPGRHGLINFQFAANNAWLAKAFRSFAHTCLPPAEITKMLRGSIHQLPGGKTSISFHPTQLNIIKALFSNPEEAITLDSLIAKAKAQLQPANAFDTVLAILAITRGLIGSQIKIANLIQPLSLENIKTHMIQKELCEESDWQHLGAELNKLKSRKTRWGLSEFLFSEQHAWRATGMHQLAMAILPDDMKNDLQKGAPRYTVVQAIHNGQPVSLKVIGLIFSPEQTQLLNAISESAMKVDPAIKLSASPDSLLKRKEPDQDEQEDQNKRSCMMASSSSSSSK